MSIQKFSFSIIGGERVKQNKEPHVTFDFVLECIKRMNLGAPTMTSLVNKARSMPPGTLPHFLKNIHTYVANLTKVPHDKTE